MVLSTYAKQRILTYFFEGKCAPTIQKMLVMEGIRVSRVSVWKFLQRFAASKSLARKEGSGRPTKLTDEATIIVEQQMLKDDETTAYQLHKLLMDKGIDISITTILRCRDSLGWTFRGSSYCQLIRVVNKQKRLEWARNYLNEAEDGFEDVVWSDESSVQLETHKRHCYRKRGRAPKSKPRYVVHQDCTYVSRCIRIYYTCA